MVLDSTYYNKEHKEIITDLVGRSFTLLEIFKMRGIGSKRMIIGEVSPNLKTYMNTVSDVNYGNIELRKNGILIYINKGLKNYTWIIPYYQLVLYKTNGISIHAQGKFIHFINNKTFRENRTFFKKLMEEKLRFDETHKFQNA
ncbi:hypothetical protein GSB9_00234 [Flavobacteriaceae bacterium GSB9]|nr:hypothetical protein GSB9_00234 [Flavobacteriaceae bacterium GSB9]